jgi:membrane-associated phospholipid phosphatase
MALAGRTLGDLVPGGPPSRRLVVVVGLLVAALALLTALVQAGELTRVDQFGLDHLMPGLRPGAPAGSDSAGLWRPFSLNVNWWSKVLDAWTYPCSVLISGLVLAAVGGYLWRRGRRAAALLAAAGWVVGNGIEVVGKDLVTRPALYGVNDGVRLHVASFDSSFPSGHMIRGSLVAAVLVLVWRRGGRWIALWATLVGPSLVLQSAHTPTDVVGGGLVGLILVLLGRELVRRYERIETAPPPAAPG